VTPIRWTAQASIQFEEAVEFIRQDNPSAAQQVAQRVIGRVEQLGAFPGLGRPGEVEGTRELVVGAYVLVYRATREVIEILYLWHGAQDWR
jgi:addiction module RelE/StbE family toxin